MKNSAKLLISMTIMLISTYLFASQSRNDVIIDTFPWMENFDSSNSVPNGWTVANLDGDETTWEIHTMFTHSAPNAMRHRYSGVIPAPGQNGWLITPGINVPETGNFAFSWWNFNDWPPAYVYNGLWINTVDDPDDRDWVELWSPSSVEFEWSQETISLMSYAGQTVYLAFIYTGYEGDTWYIDDVKVSELLNDTLPPVISHLPVVNNPRDDAPYRVTATIVDDPIWNNPIGGASLIYHAQAGTNWSAPISMTLVQGESNLYEGYIPAQPHGSFVMYKITGWDIHNNSTTYQTMYFEVDNPIWMYQDAGGSGFLSIDDGSFGPAIIFENPYYGSDIPLKILQVEGTAYSPCNTQIQVFEVDAEDNYQLISTIPVTMTGYTVDPSWEYFDITEHNVQVSSPRFMISFRPIPYGNYFIYDEDFPYTPLYVFIGDELRTAVLTGSWGIGAYVTNGSLAQLASPSNLTANVHRNNVSLAWELPEFREEAGMPQDLSGTVKQRKNNALQAADMWGERIFSKDLSQTRKLAMSHAQDQLIAGEAKSLYNPTLLGYKIYQNNALIGSLDGTTTHDYTHYGAKNGNHNYGVSALYNQGESYPVNVDVVVNLPAKPAIFEDSFETYPNFATQFVPWTLVDLDGSSTYGFSNITFPGMTGQMAYIIFNPEATVPPVTGANAYNGAKSVASFAAMNPPNNDYLITPLLQLGLDSYVSFYAKSHTAQYGLEQLSVLVSTNPDPNDIASYEPISGNNNILIPAQWGEYVYDLSAYDNSAVHIAFNCRSEDAFVLFLDKISVCSGPVSVDDESATPLITNLKGNYPNPFNPSTTIYYSLKEASPVSIDIYNLKGQHINRLVDENKIAGSHKAVWNGTDFNGNSAASGVYLYKMKTNNYEQTKRMILMK